MKDYRCLTAEELSDLQKRHRAELKEKREMIAYRKYIAQRIKARGAIVTALMTDAYEISDEEFYERMKEVLRVSGDKRIDSPAG